MQHLTPPRGLVQAIAAFLILVDIFAAWAGDDPRAYIAGTREVVFDWQTQRCFDEDIPDTAVHADRRDDGQLVGFASHHVSHRFLISGDGKFARDCTPVFVGAGNRALGRRTT